jgi:AraC-like DNA-binding protein
MQLEYYIPAPLLRPYIKFYAYYNIKKEESMERIRFLPMGFAYLVVNLKDKFIINRTDINETVGSMTSLLVGQQETYYDLLPEGDLSSFSVIFKPTGMKRLLQVPVHELRDYGYNSELVLNNKLKPLYDQIYSTRGNVADMVKLTDEYFMRKLCKATDKYFYVDHALECIQMSHGLTDIKELMKIINISGRTFRRRFLEGVGTSCAKYITITRLKYILHVLKYNYTPEINWSKLACGLGYYDQMHFIKSFKLLTGEPPTHYLTRYNNPDNILERYFMSAID